MTLGCPLSVWANWPFCRFHSRINLSAPPVASVRPSGLKRTVVIPYTPLPGFAAAAPAGDALLFATAAAAGRRSPARNVPVNAGEASPILHVAISARGLPRLA